MTVIVRLWRLALAPEARFGLCTASAWCFLVCDSLSIKPRRLNKPGTSRTTQAGGPRAPAVRRAEGQQDRDRSRASPVCSPPSRLPAPCMSSTLPGLCPGRPSPGCPERPPDHAGTRGPPPHLPSQVNILLSMCVHVFHEIIQTSISNKKSPLTFYQNP